jgi:hypothetical protein
LVLLLIFAHLNFRNIPFLFSFLSGAAEAMNQNDAVSESLDSVRRFVFFGSCSCLAHTEWWVLQMLVRTT